MTTVFTNGVFDLLHPGHFYLLEYAHGLGHKLVVGINSDSSATAIKRRPIIPEGDRAKMLKSLKWVDEVITFYTETPLSAIQGVKPDILVKGSNNPAVHGRYSHMSEEIEWIVGAQWVIDQGGMVVVPRLYGGWSTSALIEKIKQST